MHAKISPATSPSSSRSSASTSAKTLRVARRLHRRRARDLGRTIEMDMEGSVYNRRLPRNLEACSANTAIPDSPSRPSAACTEKDLQRLAPLTKNSSGQGAYREPANRRAKASPLVDGQLQTPDYSSLMEARGREFSLRPSPHTTRSWGGSRTRIRSCPPELPKERYDFS